MNLIKKYEGLRTESYRCPAGVWTIGYGLTVWPDGRKVAAGEHITEEHAEALLNDYLIREVYPVFGQFPYRLSEGQKSAVASLVYNWNAAVFLRSKLFRALCRRDWATACREWDFGFKNGLDGLYKRRTEELALFMRDI